MTKKESSIQLTIRFHFAHMKTKVKRTLRKEEQKAKFNSIIFALLIASTYSQKNLKLHHFCVKI